MIVTTARLVLVNSGNPKSDFKAFDLPLALTHSEKFNQPIFGANNWSGVCKPLYDMIPADAHFKVWFMQGGCGAFLKFTRQGLQNVRNKSADQDGFAQHIQSQAFQQKFAYVDPNDPSTIFIHQPEIVQQPSMAPPPVEHPQWQPAEPQFQQQPMQPFYQQPM